MSSSSRNTSPDYYAKNGILTVGELINALQALVKINPTNKELLVYHAEGGSLLSSHSIHMDTYVDDEYQNKKRVVIGD